MTVILQDSYFHCPSYCVFPIYILLVLDYRRSHFMDSLLNHYTDYYPCLQHIYCPLQAGRIKKVVHLTLVACFHQVSKHVDQTSMHQAHTFVYPFLINRIISKVKVICKTITCNAISLDAIPNQFELPTPIFILTLPLNLVNLLVNGKFLYQNPSFLPNMTRPPK